MLNPESLDIVQLLQINWAVLYTWAAFFAVVPFGYFFSKRDQISDEYDWMEVRGEVYNTSKMGPKGWKKFLHTWDQEL